MKELVNIDHTQYGIEETKAKEVAAMFRPMLDKMEELEGEYNEVIKLGPSKENCAKAKDLRLKYVKVRTGTAAIHKAQKAFYLAAGRFIDGWKNAQIMASEGIESRLLEFEKHFENLEKERKAKLAEARMAQLEKHEFDTPVTGIADMDDSVWKALLEGAKSAYDVRKEAERKAEEERVAAEKKAEKERIAKEKADAEERARIKAENEKLKNEMAERARLAKIEVEKQAKKDAEERKAREAEEAKRRAEEAKRQAEYEAKLKAEREAREKAEAEARAKEEAERKAREAEEAKRQAELAKGDAAKLQDLIKDLVLVKTKYSFKSKRNIKKYQQAGILLDKVINYIQDKPQQKMTADEFINKYGGTE